MPFRIADRDSDAGVLADIFQRNLTAAYISHSELQGYRAVGPDVWADNIESVLAREIAGRLGEPLAAFPSTGWKGVVEARDDAGTLIGLALVTVTRDAAVPFGIIEDIVIERPLRGTGLGEQFMRWLLASFSRADIRRVFLESGIDNEGAHHLFERLGFKTVSVVMMREE